MKRNQQGMTVIGWLVTLIVVGVFLTAAFRLGPLYLDNYFIRASVKSLHRENLAGMTDGDIRRKMASYFTINNIRNVDPKQIKVQREKNRLIVSLNYEKRVNFIGNVDFVVKFINEYDSSLRL